MNIREAKQQIKNAMIAYFTKDEFGNYLLPPERQRPVFLLGAPGIGKTAIMEQIAQELEVGFVSYSMTHHTRQSALGLPFIATKTYDGVEYQVSEYTMSEIIASVYEAMEATGRREGILFLDEINSMPLLLQAKLLRVLQEKSVTPLGASKPIPLDVRIIASTNRPISEVVASGQMREDILYRLNTISIQIPPLRRRLDDIPLLAAAFVEKYSAEMGKQVAGVAPEVTAFLMNRSWRGNVRELMRQDIVRFTCAVYNDPAQFPAFFVHKIPQRFI